MHQCVCYICLEFSFFFRCTSECGLKNDLSEGTKVLKFFNVLFAYSYVTS